MDDIKEAFNKIFGDMTISESEVALRIFEYGYKAGAAAENDACAKACDSLRPSKQEFDQRFYTACTLCANAIRARGE